MEEFITIHEAIEKQRLWGSPPEVYAIHTPTDAGEWIPNGEFAIAISDWGDSTKASSCAMFITRGGVLGGFAKGSRLDTAEARLLLQPTTHLEVTITLKKD